LSQPITVGEAVEIQIRYRQTPIQTTIASATSTEIELAPTDPMAQAASGQSCVLYRGSLCLGGGIMKKHIKR